VSVGHVSVGERLSGSKMSGRRITTARHKTAVPAFCCGKSAEIGQQQLVARLGYVLHNTVLAISYNSKYIV